MHEEKTMQTLSERQSNGLILRHKSLFWAHIMIVDYDAIHAWQYCPRYFQSSIVSFCLIVLHYFFCSITYQNCQTSPASLHHPILCLTIIPDILGLGGWVLGVLLKKIHFIRYQKVLIHLS